MSAILDYTAHRDGDGGLAWTRAATISPVPISPSDLPWWGWLLCSLGAGVISWIAIEVSESKNGCLAALAAFVSGLIAVITGVMGVILFVKWVWTS